MLGLYVDLRSMELPRESRTQKKLSKGISQERTLFLTLVPS